MRTSSAGKALSRATARNCFLINQFATPGLGSIMAGRRWVGCGQLLLALAGFAMVLGWFALLANNFYQQLMDDAPPQSPAWLGKAGAVVFGLAWLWSLVTSLSILRSAKDNPANVPPRLP
ncbi:conserved hypothetical protein [Verrucomicrobia bacterium]|nr:conserved hypothetical protein [Verrucomicrobiota bacterium]